MNEETYYRLDWMVPARNAISKRAYWSAVSEGIASETEAQDQYKWWMKEQPQNDYRIVRVTQTAVSPALPRCQNCGKVMDKSICPHCGYVQK